MCGGVGEREYYCGRLGLSLMGWGWWRGIANVKERGFRRTAIDNSPGASCFKMKFSSAKSLVP